MSPAILDPFTSEFSMIFVGGGGQQPPLQGPVSEHAVAALSSFIYGIFQEDDKVRLTHQSAWSENF